MNRIEIEAKVRLIEINREDRESYDAEYLSVKTHSTDTNLVLLETGSAFDTQSITVSRSDLMRALDATNCTI